MIRMAGMTPFHLLPEILSDADFAPAKAVKPASLWRNKWGSPEDCRSIDMATGRKCFLRQGEIVWGTKLFPTKELAEEYAQRAMDLNLCAGVAPLEYLGAHAVEGDA